MSKIHIVKYKDFDENQNLVEKEKTITEPENYFPASTLNFNFNEKGLILAPFTSEEEAEQTKINDSSSFYSLSGSKAKTIIQYPHHRYLQTIKGVVPTFDKKAQWRMWFGKVQEDVILYQVYGKILPEEPLWDDKIIVVDKRRRFVKGAEWINYELDALVYQLDKPLAEYDEFISGDNTYASEFIIDNSYGYYDEFLSDKHKYGVADIKDTQLEIQDNWENYKYQLHLMAWGECVNKVMLLTIVKNADPQWLMKDYDGNVTKKMFTAYDEFVDGVINKGLDFEVVADKNCLTEVPEVAEIKNIIAKLPAKKYLQEQATADFKELSDQLKIKLAEINKNNLFDITVVPEDDFAKKITLKTSKVSKKVVLDVPLLETFLQNSDVVKVITSNGKEIPFNINNFYKLTYTGGSPTLIVSLKEKVTVSPEIEEIVGVKLSEKYSY